MPGKLKRGKKDLVAAHILGCLLGALITTGIIFFIGTGTGERDSKPSERNESMIEYGYEHLELESDSRGYMYYLTRNSVPTKKVVQLILDHLGLEIIKLSVHGEKVMLSPKLGIASQKRPVK